MTLPSPPRLSNLITPEQGAILAMMVKRARPWPGGGWWVELSARFVGVGLGVPRMKAWRLLRSLSSQLSLSSMRGREAERQGVVLGGGRKRLSRPGTVYRIPDAVHRLGQLLIATGAIWWHPPSTSRTWWAVRGLDVQRARGTCYCPHPHHQGDRARCAFERHASGTWHLTCQRCEDGAGRPLTFFARQGPNGIEASLTHRAHVHGGRGGEGDLHGFTSAEHRIRSKRALGLPLSYHEESAAEAARVSSMAPPPAPSMTEAGEPAGERISLSHRDSTDQRTDLLVEDASAVPGFSAVARAAGEWVDALRCAVEDARRRAAVRGPWRRPKARRRRPDDERAGEHRSGAPPTRHDAEGNPWRLVFPDG